MPPQEDTHEKSHIVLQLPFEQEGHLTQIAGDVAEQWLKPVRPS